MDEQVDQLHWLLLGDIVFKVRRNHRSRGWILRSLASGVFIKSAHDDPPTTLR